MRPMPLVCLVLLLVSPCSAWASAPVFESPHVHPLELTPDGTRLLAVNTDDHRLSVFDVTGSVPLLLAEIPVGLEPVTVRARTQDEAWVVNHISDSISIVDLSTGNVIRTILVGDEPTDVVFAGSPEKAFVCISQEDRVRVYDAVSPGAPLADLLLEGSDPRSLVVRGGTVWVTVGDSQNKTTVVPEAVVSGSLGLPAPSPPMDPGLPAAPGTGLIVRHNGTNWVDELARPWDFAVPYQLHDRDLIGIDVSALAITGHVTGVGTALFNVAVHPQTQDLYVTHLEAFNEVRFEPNLQGQFLHNRVAIVNPATSSVAPVHLNSHINYAVPAGSDAERSLSLGMPLDLLITPDGTQVYVAAFGSAQVGVLDASGSVVDRIPVGNGPTGLAYDDSGDRLFVLEKNDGTVSVVDPVSKVRTTAPLGFAALSAAVVQGRTLFYDTRNSSAHGDLSCASCHLFAGMDNLSWDLGDPKGAFQAPPPGQLGSAGFHPMKGPMATQSLKGLDTTAPFHWRGDRAALSDFNNAFVSLMGRGTPLSPAEFADFEAFVLAVSYPPNPLRDLTNGYLPTSDGSDPAAGETAFMTGSLVGGIDCVTCHALPTGENGLIIPASALLEPQDMVVPQLRNMYEKTRFDNTASITGRGFGYTHDGAVDDLFSFLQFPGFTFVNDDQRRDVAAFLMAFDTGTHPAVGAQWTMDGSNELAGTQRLDDLEAAADASVIGLIVKGRTAGGDLRGWKYTGSGFYAPDRVAEAPVSRAGLLLSAGPGTEITFTGVPAGCETRLGVDRDEDGFWDRDELDAGSDPSDPNSTPSTLSVDGDPAASPGMLLRATPNPTFGGRVTRLAYSVPVSGRATLELFDIRGRLLRSLVDNPHHAAGQFEVAWDGQDSRGAWVARGVYFVRLRTETGQRSQRLVVTP